MIHKAIYDYLCITQQATHMEDLAIMFDTDERTVRKVIEQINLEEVQVNGYMGNKEIIGDINGYYVATNIDHLKYIRNKIIKQLKKKVKRLKKLDRQFKQGQIMFDFEEEELKIIKEYENVRYITINELAEKLNITRETVHRMIKDNDDFPYLMVGKVKRFDFEDVEKWLKEKQKKA